MTAAEKKKAIAAIDLCLSEVGGDMEEADRLLDERLEIMHTRRTPKKPEFKTDKAMSMNDLQDSIRSLREQARSDDMEGDALHALLEALFDLLDDMASVIDDIEEGQS